MALTGEPISMMLGLGAGLAFDLYGTSKTIEGEKAYNAAQVGVIQTQQKENEQRRQFMELDNRRKQLENLRNTQKARSLALSNASNQGASFGSSLQGGYGQVMGAGAFNTAGLAQSKEIGENLFNLTNTEDQFKIAASNANLEIQKGQGFTSIGNSLIGGSSSFGRLFSGSGS